MRLVAIAVGGWLRRPAPVMHAVKKPDAEMGSQRARSMLAANGYRAASWLSPDTPWRATRQQRTVSDRRNCMGNTEPPGGLRPDGPDWPGVWLRRAVAGLVDRLGGNTHCRKSCSLPTLRHRILWTVAVPGTTKPTACSTLFAS